MDNIKLQDVAEVIIINDTTGEHWYYGCTDETAISKTVDKEILTGGIGNKQCGVLFTNQSYQVTITPTLFATNFLETQTGTTFTSGSVDVWKKEEVIAVDDGAGGAEATIDGTPIDDEVYVVDKNNESFTGTFATGTVTITDGVIGDTYIIMYQENEATADTLDFDSGTFPKNVHLQLHTIAYEPKTENVTHDIYINFPIASPDGALDMTLTKGTNTQTPITFDILDNAGSYGTYTVVERA